WARGEITDSSDVDLLVVLDPSLPITRALYRSWDERPLTWGGRGVDVHLVHLPEADAEISGTWAEAATDGIVLFERGLELSRRLSAMRRRIAAGEVVRHVAHGQPYWVRGQ
ncbi:nucleotidyltransferase domain-containing protein, partial [bacterium]|nr:nucleotidyltransferase domain-containing protein [bacterium]